MDNDNQVTELRARVETLERIVDRLTVALQGHHKAFEILLADLTAHETRSTMN